MPGNHDLLRTVEVSRGDNFALCRTTQNLFQLLFRQLQKGGHSACSRRNGFLHIPAAISYQTNCVGKGQGPGCHQR